MSDDLQKHLAEIEVLKQASEYALAIKKMKKLALKYDKAGLYNGLAILYAKNNQFEQAIENYQKSIALNDNIAAKSNLADLYLTQSFAMYNTVLQTKECPHTSKKLFFLYLAANNTKKALECLRKSSRYFYKKSLYKKVEENFKLLRQFDTLKGKDYNLLGLIYSKLNEKELSIHSFKQAIDSGYTIASYNLGDLYLSAYDIENAIATFEKLLDINTPHDKVYFKLAECYLQNKELDKAIEYFRQSLALNDNARIRNKYAQTLLLNGDLKEGFKEYEARLQLDKNRVISKLCNQPLWKGENIEGKKILVYREQGIGDNIHFARYFEPLKKLGVTIIYRCNPQLVKLFETIECIDLLITKDEDIHLHSYDYHVSLLSLPYRFGCDKDKIPLNIPYFFPPKKKLIENLNPSQFNIGIVWKGGPHSSNNKKRNVSIKYFEQLFDTASTTFYSLQLKQDNEEIAENGFEKQIIDISHRLKSFLDTAQVIEQLDLIISVDTSVLHLAGALGKKAWLPLQYVPDFRWLLKGDYSIWYPSVRLFRETKRKEDGNWDDAFKSMKKALIQEVNNKK